MASEVCSQPISGTTGRAFLADLTQKGQEFKPRIIPLGSAPPNFLNNDAILELASENPAVARMRDLFREIVIPLVARVAPQKAFMLAQTIHPRLRQHEYVEARFRLALYANRPR